MSSLIEAQTGHPDSSTGQGAFQESRRQGMRSEVSEGLGSCRLVRRRMAPERAGRRRHSARPASARWWRAGMLLAFPWVSIGSASATDCVAPLPVEARSGRDRIVGGEESGRGAWPFQVSVRLSGGHVCGGTVVGASSVLTAAHCVTFPGSTKPIESDRITVAIGELELRGVPTLAVRSVSVHPDYLGDPVGGADLAVLGLASPSAAPPIQFAAATPPGTCAVVLGWGSMQPQRADRQATAQGPAMSQRLQQAAVPIVPRSVCQSVYRDLAGDQFCAGYSRGGVDTCAGDSGGPVLVESGGRWLQLGVTSRGHGCAASNAYGVYTSVVTHRGWIASRIDSSVR